ncbi:Integrin alpha-X [Myotis davidii]|uniref:Integrin alpha-X n=1 Tax=Myotis davidii TaxID=225400 RepID=L5MA65_MYODS|nr:Integrin alpha-X [Myotis davidii]
MCLRIQCDIASFGSQEEFGVALTSNLSFDWYIKTPHNHLQVVSTAEILFDDRRFALPSGQEVLVRAQTETKVEPYEVYDPVPLIVGSSVGGLVLLALITAALYKDGPVLGAVGSYSWSGGAFLYPQNKKPPTFINMSQENLDMMDSYLGERRLWLTRPVLRVWVDIRITPAEIARSVFECRENTASIRDLGDATVCLRVHESPRTRLGNLQSDVTFDLTLDPGHLSPRAIFKETNTRHLSRVRVLGLRQHCEDVKLLLPACVEDAMIPITLSLNFSLVGQPIPSFGNLQPILAPDTRRHFTTSLPFEKNCGDDHVCQDDLGITVDASGLETLVVGNTLELNMGVKVWNEGEDSYGTTVTFSYPPGLSYRRATVTQSRPPSRSLQLACDSGSQDAWSTRCSLKHIIFREGAQVTFVATFDVSPKAILGDRLLLMANVSSENNSPRTSRTTSRLELPVKYSVYIVVSRCRSRT